MRQKNLLIADISETFHKSALCVRLAHLEIKQRYHRTVLGPIWLVISMIVWIGAMGFVFTKLFKIDGKAYFPYASAGMILWNTFVATLNEAPSVFMSKRPMLANIKLPYFLFVLGLNYKNWVVYLHGLAAFFLLMPFFSLNYTWHIMLFLPNFLLVFWNLLWMSILLAVLGARYKDIQPMVQNILQATFFITPIFWQPELLGGYHLIYNLNPFHHLLELMRSPLIGATPSLMTYIATLAMAVFGTMLSLEVFGRCYKRIYYWI